MSYTITTQKSWARTQQELASEFDKWRVTEWTTNYPRGARLEGRSQSELDRTVTLSYTKNGKQINLTMSSQARAVDNLRALYLSIEAMRMIEKRGLSEAVQSAYTQIAAPKQKRSPYEVLMILENSPLDVAEAVYKNLAKKFHPDAGGNVEQFKELQAAIEEIRKDNK
jgi:hypothetical protein